MQHLKLKVVNCFCVVIFIFTFSYRVAAICIWSRIYTDLDISPRKMLMALSASTKARISANRDQAFQHMSVKIMMACLVLILS